MFRSSNPTLTPLCIAALVGLAAGGAAAMDPDVERIAADASFPPPYDSAAIARVSTWATGWC